MKTLTLGQGQTIYPGAQWKELAPSSGPFPLQALTGAVSTIELFLSEAFPGQSFEAVELEGSEPEPGDVFLLWLMSPWGAGAGPTWVCAVTTERLSPSRVSVSG